MQHQPQERALKSEIRGLDISETFLADSRARDDASCRGMSGDDEPAAGSKRFSDRLNSNLL
eukprot:m.131967 g.131967  ORF g.131967 m.131967 type:complete len:61 (+) comp52372_c0_seq5:470-652(+)